MSIIAGYCALAFLKALTCGGSARSPSKHFEVVGGMTSITTGMAQRQKQTYKK